MNLFKIVISNLLHRPLTVLLNVVLLALSTGIIALLLHVQSQIEHKFETDLRDIDMVLGAKGSPLQLVLSAVYHVDAPTGNISAEEVERIRKNPMVRQMIPLAYGDSYKGFRIVGTDTSYIGKYDGKMATGALFSANMQVVIGSSVAKATGLQVGQTFHGTHGEAEEGEVHEHLDYIVSGILSPTQSVLDQLILTPVASVWKMHDEAEPHEDEEKQESAMATPEHHTESEEAQGDSEAQGDLTAVLIKFRSPMGIMTLPRMVNETTKMQAAVPALEINRLMALMGIGVTTLQGIALAIMLISGFSVFIALYNRLKERRYELALLRSMGCRRSTLFALLLAEGGLLALAGAATGSLLSRVGIGVLNATAAKEMRIQLTYQWLPQEGILWGIVLLIGLLAALIPAIRAYKMNVSATLAAS